MDQLTEKAKSLDDILAEMYDISTRFHGLIQLHNDIERKMPNCHAKDMVRGKLRKHVQVADQELQLLIDDMVTRFTA